MIHFLFTLFKPVASSFQKLTSRSKVANAFRRPSVLIETPAHRLINQNNEQLTSCTLTFLPNDVQKFTERESALLKHNNKEEKEILPFVTQYQPSVSTLKEVLMKKWNLIQNQPLLRQIFKEPPIISYKKGKSLKELCSLELKYKRFTQGFSPVQMCGLSPLTFSQVNKNVSYLSDTNFTHLYLQVKYAQCQAQIAHLIS